MSTRIALHSFLVYDGAMNDLPPLGANVKEYTVSELSLALKREIEDAFGFVRVRGEISGFRRHVSGHLYLSLKDEGAVLDAVIWKGTAQSLAIAPEDGMEVVCTGRLSTYPQRSRYQLIIETIEFAGIGALLKMLEERRQRLAAEGLFAEERKKKLPHLPEVIGVVTSPSGAVIRDILQRLADRFPRRVLLWPVAVQGEGAAEQVAAAIEGFNRLPQGAVPRPDLIIVARGGGSLEDLMAFNEEIVVRAAAASAIPLVSAIGHETDWTLIDYASDRRAPTPTAAAEMAVPVRLDLLSDLESGSARLASSLSRFMNERRMALSGLARGLPDPQGLIGNATQHLDDLAERLRRASKARLSLLYQALAAARLRPQALAAEIARLKERTAESDARMKAAIARLLTRRRETVSGLARGLPVPQDLLRGAAQVLDDRAERLSLALKRHLFHLTQQLAAARLRPQALSAEIARLEARTAETETRLSAATALFLSRRREAVDNFAGRLSTHAERHESLLARGYVVVRDGLGEVLTRAARVFSGMALELEFQDGRVDAVAGKKRRATGREPDAPQRQGRLF